MGRCNALCATSRTLASVLSLQRAPWPRRAETQDEVGEENFKVEEIKKTPAQTLRIMDGINKNDLLSG